ncbi:hypothetical protein [Novosphingobium sp.]|uniref:hypothetical protein n=1 Tax=Novosphingobium sp. TaxID=1874826 RepID=UPI0031DB5250
MPETWQAPTRQHRGDGEEIGERERDLARQALLCWRFKQAGAQPAGRNGVHMLYARPLAARPAAANPPAARGG